MLDMTPQEIFDCALSSDCGVEIVLDDPWSVRSVRRRLYAEREKLRTSGYDDYDGLSFLIKDHDLWVIPRDRLPEAEKITTLDCRPLEPNELPDRILNRGKSRRSYCIS